MILFAAGRSDALKRLLVEVIPGKKRLEEMIDVHAAVEKNTRNAVGSCNDDVS
jgi:hypothetical protein